MRRWVSASEEETRELGRSLAAELRPDGILLLLGDLGSGKTVLAQGVGSGLGIDSAEIQSPTFTLIREHAGDRGRLVHLDLYRLEASQLGELGLDELFLDKSVKVIEWADRLPRPPEGALTLELRRGVEGGEREIRQLLDSASKGDGDEG